MNECNEIMKIGNRLISEDSTMRLDRFEKTTPEEEWKETNMETIDRR
jgi:hypothetical protein